LEGRFAADVVGSSMPVRRAFNLALLVVGSLGARDGDAQEKSKETIRYQPPQESDGISVIQHLMEVGRQAIKDDLSNSGL
jgi:hypothetical protein